MFLIYALIFFYFYAIVLLTLPPSGKKLTMSLSIAGLKNATQIVSQYHLHIANR